MTACWYSVHVEARAPEGVAPLTYVDDLLQRFADRLDDKGLHAASSVGPTSWSAQISVEADHAPAAAEAGYLAVCIAAALAGLPDWPIARLEVLTEPELLRSLAAPALPDLVSGPEAAGILGVSRQRLHQLRGRGDFPPPWIERPGAVLWLRAAVDRFAERWDRRPGRRRLVAVDGATGEQQNPPADP